MADSHLEKDFNVYRVSHAKISVFAKTMKKSIDSSDITGNI